MVWDTVLRMGTNDTNHSSTSVTQMTWAHPAQQSRSARTMAALLDSAERLLEQQPLAQVSVHAIAAGADSSVGAFYGRFRGKQDLIRALYQRYVEVSRATLSRFGPQAWAGVGLREVIGSFCAFLVRDYRQRPGVRRAFVAAIPRDPELLAMAGAITADTCGAFETLLAARRDEHDHPDPSVAAAIVHRLLYGALDQDLGFAGPGTLGASLDEAVVAGQLAHAVTAYLGVRP